MTIAGVTIDDTNLTSFTLNGVTPDRITNISQNGEQRDSVLVSNTFKYTMRLSSLDKTIFDDLFAALKTKSNDYEQILIDMYGIIKAEIPDISLVDNTSLNFDFDMSQLSFENKGGYWNITIPLQYIEYY